MEALLSTATLLQMFPVISACSSFLAKQLDPSNCIGFALFAEQQSCSSLLNLATSYICQHFLSVCKNQEFFQLNMEQISNLLRNNDLNVDSEEEVFNALISWIEHDAESRQKHLPKLLEYIKLPLLKPQFLVDYVEKHCDNKKCMELVMEAFKFHLLPDRRTITNLDRRTPRKSTIGRLLAIGGMDIHIESYNYRLDKWHITKNMPTKRLQFGAVLMDDKLIIVGGRDGLKTLNSVEMVNLNTMVWTSLNSMGTPRYAYS